MKIVPEGQEYRHGSRASGHLQDRRMLSAAQHDDRQRWAFRTRRRGEFTRRLAECASSPYEFRSMLYASLDRPYVPSEAAADDAGNGSCSESVVSRIFIWRR